MTLKDLIKQDVHGVFFNLDEFADIHTINGVEMPCQVDNNERLEREKRFSQHMDGVYMDSVPIYVPAEYFDKLPTRGATLSFDGKQFRVAEATDEGQVYFIVLEATESMGRGWRP